MLEVESLMALDIEELRRIRMCIEKEREKNRVVWLEACERIELILEKTICCEVCEEECLVLG